MTTPIKWGIIGPGKIARKFATDIKVTSNAVLYAVASRSETQAESFAKEFGAPHAYAGYEAMLECPDLDAIYIATPHIFHAEHALMCLDAGIPVLCEKPFAINTKQVKAMIAKAQAKDVFLMEALWTAFLPTMKATKTLLADGDLGEVFSIRADFGFKAPYLPDKRIFNSKLGGGALLDIGIYPVFLALFLFGVPEQIKASAKIGATGVDEEIGIMFSYRDGKMAHLHSTVLTNTNTEAFIYGTKGTIHLHGRWFTPTTMHLDLFDAPSQKKFQFDYKSGGFEYEIEEASQCIANGKKESEILPLAFSLQLIETLDAIRQEIGLIYEMDR